MTITALLMVVLKLAIAGLIFWLLNWAVDAVGVPQPFNKVIKVVLIVVAVAYCILVLLSLLGAHILGPV